MMIHIGIRDPGTFVEFIESLHLFFTDKDKYLQSERKFETVEMYEKFYASNKTIHLCVHLSAFGFIRFQNVWLTRNTDLRVGDIAWMWNAEKKNYGLCFTGVFWKLLEDEIREICEHLGVSCVVECLR